jgi:hypothetical protein
MTPAERQLLKAIGQVLARGQDETIKSVEEMDHHDDFDRKLLAYSRTNFDLLNGALAEMEKEDSSVSRSSSSRGPISWYIFSNALSELEKQILEGDS